MTEGFALAGTRDAAAISELEHDWPQWQIWVIYPVISLRYGTWCARRWADTDAVPAQTINAHSAEELDQLIEDQVSGEESR